MKNILENDLIFKKLSLISGCWTLIKWNDDDDASEEESASNSKLDLYCLSWDTEVFSSLQVLSLEVVG